MVSGPNGSSALDDPMRVDLPPQRTIPPVFMASGNSNAKFKMQTACCSPRRGECRYGYHTRCCEAYLMCILHFEFCITREEAFRRRNSNGRARARQVSP